MCGISGVILTNSRTIDNIDIRDGKALLNNLIHRGPDGSGSWTNNDNIILNHNRLALIDLTNNAAQPMLDIKETVSVVFNGEIYNYLELRAQLVNLGYSFSSQSDTEIIIAGYHHWGLEIFDKIDGMFAIVLYDVKQKKTFFCRDIIGIKPLYYSYHEDRFIFASEVKSFNIVEGITLTTSKAAFVSFNLFGFVSEPHTCYNEVKAFEPGFLYVIDNKSNLKILKKKNLSNLVSNNLNYNNNEVLEGLTKSIELTTLSDAKISILLSSGIDSNFIYNQTTSKNLETVTFSNAESEIFNVIEKTKSNHLFHYNSNEKRILFSEYLDAMDQPTIDGFNIYIISKFLKTKGLKAGILGTGSDELFQGYHFYKYLKLVSRNKKLFKLFYPKKFMYYLGIVKNKKHLDLNNYLDSDISLYIFFRSINSISTLKEKYGKDFINSCLVDLNLESIFSNLTIEALDLDKKLKILDLSFYLRNQLMKDADIFSMRNGIEMRVPFLNKNILSISLNSNLTSKKILIDHINNDNLKKFLLNRKKTGFDITKNLVEMNDFINTINNHYFKMYTNTN